MSGHQISFLAFAESRQALCTPPAKSSANPTDEAGLVAHPSVGGGECIQPHADFAEFDRLTVLAKSTSVIPFADPYSNGGYVLMALANCCAPIFPGRASQSELIDRLRYHANVCIQAGC